MVYLGFGTNDEITLQTSHHLLTRNPKEGSESLTY